MRDSIVFDDGIRFTETIRARVPADFCEQVKQSAAAEGVVVAEFTRRALAERIARSAREASASPASHGAPVQPRDP